MEKQSPTGMTTASVFGLGKLGAPWAACLAARGIRVIGVDVDAEKVACINRGVAPVFEPGLDEMIAASKARLSATTDCAAAVLGSEVTFIVVPTPSTDSGDFSTRFVERVCKEIGAALRRKPEYHLVVLSSTVLPGAMDKKVKPALEAASGKQCGRDFGLCYNPRFIALGNVIQGFLNPDLVLIGESDSRAGEMLDRLYWTVLTNDAPLVRMNFVNAEVAKLAVNTYVTMKISFSNTLRAICEQLPEANVDVVTNAVGLDKRIGRQYLKGALGYGGPCFPRDNLALSYLARQVGVPATLAEATHAVNLSQVSGLLALVKARLRPWGTVGVLGLAYKPQTDVIEASQAFELVQALASGGTPVVVYDPKALDIARGQLDGRVTLAASMQECARKADVLVVAVPWDEFKQLKPADLAREGPRPVLIDCWRALDGAAFASVAEYVPLGVGMFSR